MGQPVVHFEIIGEDGAALQSLYSQLFGWKSDAYNPMNYGVLQRDENLSPEGIGIGGGIGEMEGYPGGVTFFVGVPDVEAALAKAESLGGTRVADPYEVMEGVVIGRVKDPEGHELGLIDILVVMSVSASAATPPS
jgi:uncharacterized protein